MVRIHHLPPFSLHAGISAAQSAQDFMRFNKMVDTAILDLTDLPKTHQMARFMKPTPRLWALFAAVICGFSALAQTTVSLPGRVVVKLSPDYVRPVVYALNAPSATAVGTLLALN